jgi:hypothetical protein
LHFKYMTDLGNLQQKVAHDKGETDGWNAKVKEEQKDLACGVLIKCADICNVVSRQSSRQCTLRPTDIISRRASSTRLPSGPTS